MGINHVVYLLLLYKGVQAQTGHHRLIVATSVLANSLEKVIDKCLGTWPSELEDLVTYKAGSGGVARPWIRSLFWVRSWRNGMSKGLQLSSRLLM